MTYSMCVPIYAILCLLLITFTTKKEEVELGWFFT